MITLKRILVIHLALAVLLTMDAQAFQTKQKKKPEEKLENCASELPVNWKELEAEFDAIMETAVDTAVEQAVEQAVNDVLQKTAEEYEKKMQKEREKKRFWRHFAITQTAVIAAGCLTGITVYRILQ